MCTHALTWLIDQIDEVINGRIFVAPIHSFRVGYKPERMFEVFGKETGEFPVYDSNDLQGFWIDNYVVLCEVVVTVDEVLGG